MKFKRQFAQASLITLAMMIVGYLGTMISAGDIDTSGLALGAFSMFLMFVGAFAFLATLLWWLAAVIISGLHSRHTKS